MNCKHEILKPGGYVGCAIEGAYLSSRGRYYVARSSEVLAEVQQAIDRSETRPGR